MTGSAHRSEPTCTAGFAREGRPWLPTSPARRRALASRRWHPWRRLRGRLRGGDSCGGFAARRPWKWASARSRRTPGPRRPSPWAAPRPEGRRRRCHSRPLRRSLPGPHSQQPGPRRMGAPRKRGLRDGRRRRGGRGSRYGLQRRDRRRSLGHAGSTGSRGLDAPWQGRVAVSLAGLDELQLDSLVDRTVAVTGRFDREA